jgi:hypothetical protein
MNLKVFSTTFFISKLESWFLALSVFLKKISYFVASKSPGDLGGYFLGLPLPLLGFPSNNSECFVFIWLFNAGWDKNDFPQFGTLQKKFLPSCSCLERRRLSII